MKKSFFAKFYYLCTTFLVIGILLSGTLVLITANRMYRKEVYNEIDTLTQRMLTDIATVYDENELIASEQISQIMSDYARVDDVSFFIFDSVGNYVTSSNNGTENEKNVNFSKSFLNNLGDDTYFEIGYINGLSDELNVCYVKKIQLDTDENDSSDENDASPSYYVLSLTSAENVNSFFSKTFIFFGISTACITFLGALIFLNMAKKLVAPIKEMSETAENFMKGDYSEKLKIDYTEELRRLALSFNEMANTISKNETTHKNFIANISHELRTPMTTIGGFIDGMLDGTIPQEEHEHYMKLVSSEIKRLSRLVRTMLSISKFESSEVSITYASVNLNKIAIKTFLMFEQQINDKNVNVEGLDCDTVIIDADYDLMAQMFFNIIENAVKFANKGGTITLDLHKTDIHAIISIKNTGDGLSEEEIPKIFKRFYKTDESRSIDATGIGLGLSIVRSIANLHNGVIAVKSIKGEYTEFLIELPLFKPQPK